MTAGKAKLVLSLAAGLLVAFVASNALAALKIADPAGLTMAQTADGDGAMVWANEGASWYLSEILKSYESADSRDLRMSDDGTTYLAPLFPSSSGPADDNSEPEIKVVSVALPGAGAIPPSVNGTRLGVRGLRCR